jgi:hypothetical protein
VVAAAKAPAMAAFLRSPSIGWEWLRRGLMSEPQRRAIRPRFG